MDATRTVLRLLEDLEVDPLDDPAGPVPLAHYSEPVAFDPKNVSDLIATATFFKEQAQEAGALSRGVLRRHTTNKDIDRVMLQLAIEDMVDTEQRLHSVYTCLKREMHSIWN